jgi:hypothetical protein
MADKNSTNQINAGILNDYSVKPRNLTEYTAFRGVTDFTQIGQFNQFETGYSFLSVIKMPTFIEHLAALNDDVLTMANSFKHMLEYEFRGLSGLPDITGQTGQITDGINEMNYINRVTMDTSITVSIPYFEKSGSLITRFTEYYLTGIKDRMSQAKTYHGLIAMDDLHPGLENEVFTLLYYVTDNTYLRLERAVLLANAQITTAETSMYDTSRDQINNKETTIQFNCFPVMGEKVDKAASALLQDITGVNVGYKNKTLKYTKVNNDTYLVKEIAGGTGRAALDSNDYTYGIMDDRSASKIGPLVTAMNIERTTSSGSNGSPIIASADAEQARKRLDDYLEAQRKQRLEQMANGVGSRA